LEWSEKWSDREREIIKLILNNPRITRREFVEKLNINSSAIQKQLNKLKIKKIIERIGSAKGGYWRVIDN
jgi:ATP-dependent DNA helicase RecG